MEKYNLEKFIEFVADLVDEFDFFCEVNINSKYYFLNGGCYELFKVVNHYFKDTKCVINKDLTHCAIFYNNEIYDITGKIKNKQDYRFIDKEDICYLENILNIKELKNENIINELDKCRIKGILYK